MTQHKDIIDFELMRLKEELNKHRRHGAIPKSFLDGVFTIQDIQRHQHLLNSDEAASANNIIAAYRVADEKQYSNLHSSLVKEYQAFWRNCCTGSSDWMFPGVLKKYRKNINPVRSLYYEMREIMFSYDPDNPHHTWMVDTFQDPVFINQLKECTWKDKIKLDKLIDRYHPMFVNTSHTMPIEMVHMIQSRQDLVEYVQLFNQFQKWRPDE